MCVAIIGETTMIVIATEDVTMTVSKTEEMMENVKETEDVITIANVKEEMIAAGKEIHPVVVMVKNLFRLEHLVDSRIKVLVVVRARASRIKRETSFAAFPKFVRCFVIL